MAAVAALGLLAETSPVLEGFLAFTAVVQTVLLAWLATVPRWGAKAGAEGRADDRNRAKQRRSTDDDEHQGAGAGGAQR